MNVFKCDTALTLTREVEVIYEVEDGLVFIEDVTHEGVSVELTGEQWRYLYVALDEGVRDLEGVQP
tara:strand:- start:74 stop:271 length:198 start_codon:yes stop_codon:yes gene_type:complete